MSKRKLIEVDTHRGQMWRTVVGGADACDDMINSAEEESSPLYNKVKNMTCLATAHTSSFLSLPDDVLEHVLEYCTASEVLSCGRTCQSLLSAASSPSLWQKLTNALAPSSAIITEAPWRELYRSITLSNATTSAKDLLREAAGASSADSKEEGVENTLRPSLCATLLEAALRQHSGVAGALNRVGSLLQERCGCVGQQACYWSSESSEDPGMEWLAYKLQSNVCLVAGFMVTPYQAFWHPSAPVYCSDTIQFEFCFPGDMDKPYFQSGIIPLQKEFKPQVFRFRNPVLFLGGIVRILLRGKQQQTFSRTTKAEYYTCISNVKCLGAELLGFESVQLGSQWTVYSNL